MREVFDLDKSLGEVEINIAFYSPKDSFKMTLLYPQGFVQDKKRTLQVAENFRMVGSLVETLGVSTSDPTYDKILPLLATIVMTHRLNHDHCQILLIESKGGKLQNRVQFV